MAEYICHACYIELSIEILSVPGEETRFDEGCSFQICPNCGGDDLRLKEENDA